MLDTVMMIIFAITTSVLLGDWVHRHIPLREVSAGTKIYVKSKIYKKMISDDILFAKRRNIVAAWALEDGDLWKEHDYLLVDRAFNVFRKGNYYLMANGDTYRIVKCMSAAAGMPPIFDGHETLITHDVIGEVFCVLRNNQFDYSIRNNWQQSK